MKTLRFSLLLFFVLISFYSLSQDLLIAAKKGPKWGYINPSGEFIIQPKFDQAYPMLKGMGVVEENQMMGVIDSKGKWVIDPRKGAMNPEINSNRITCMNDLSKWGAIDTKGKTSVEFEYDAMTHYHNGLVVAGKKAGTDIFRILVLDTIGNAVISFDNIYWPSSAFASRKKVREGYVSVLVDGEFKGLLNESSLKIEDRTLYFALLDVRNKRLINAKINSLQTEVREGRLNQAIDGIAYSWAVPLSVELSLSEAKFSFLSPAIYSFSSGIAAIQKNGKWAFIDKDGSLLSETNLPAEEYKSDDPMYFGGFVIYRKPNGTGIFTDLNGHQKIALEFEELYPFQYGLAIVKQKGKYGLIQKDGSWAVPAEFDDLRF